MNKTKFKRNCPKCNKEKIYSTKTHLERAIRDNSLCRFCAQKKVAEQRLAIITPDILEQRKENNKKRKDKYWPRYYLKNKDKIKERKRKIRASVEGKKKMKEYRDMYYKTTKGKEVRKAYKKKQIQDPIYKLNIYISNDIRRSLRHKNISKNKQHWENIVGYTIDVLIFNIEKQFKDGMNWDNYGKWQIDHIIPMSFFKYKSINDVEFKMCWRLENLQPLWKEDNLDKKAKVYKPEYYLNL